MVDLIAKELKKYVCFLSTTTGEKKNPPEIR